jgi:hypothetical protein
LLPDPRVQQSELFITVAQQQRGGRGRPDRRDNLTKRRLAADKAAKLSENASLGGLEGAAFHLQHGRAAAARPLGKGGKQS